MLNEQQDVGIATIVFYVPAVALTAYLLFHRHGRPRMAWYFLFMCSLVRVASGVVFILYEKHKNSVGLLITAIILLSVGVMPLIATIIGFLRIIMYIDFRTSSHLPKAVILSRMIFLISVVLLIVGGVYEGNYKKQSDVSLGLRLVKAGYIVAAIALTYLVGFQAYLWGRRRDLSSDSKTVLKGTSFAVPFFIIRIAYAMLSIFDLDDLRWSSLYGSIGIFVTMALLMEYIIMIGFIVVGYCISPQRAKRPVNDVRGIPAQTVRDSSQPTKGFFPRVKQMWDERD